MDRISWPCGQWRLGSLAIKVMVAVKENMEKWARAQCWLSVHFCFSQVSFARVAQLSTFFCKPLANKKNTHEWTHTGEKHFACLQCDKAFKESDKLQWHERTHTGEKPFACYQCDKAFAQFNSLKRHERTQSGKKPFACSKCDKAFMHSGDLKTHERIHTGEKPNVTRHTNNYIFCCIILGHPRLSVYKADL